MNPDRALDFLDFVRARHDVWENRQQGFPPPWTEDPIIRTRKFTNVFRVLDPGSQFVITDLLPGCDPETFLMRCFLYRHTNLPAAWRAFAAEWGSYPTVGDWEALRGFWKDSGVKVFSGAYMIYPQSSIPGTNKVDSIIDLTQRLYTEGVFAAFLQQPNQHLRFLTLRANKGVADFMSMQILTDFGYSTEFREDEFVVPGPGARKGAAALGMTGEEAVEWAYRALSENIYTAPTLRGRTPSRMDAQNCLCEFSKWVRYSQRPVPDKPYVPAHPGPQPEPVLPALWRTG